MQNLTKIIIVDLDGTLCDITHRKKYIDGSMGKKDWEKFYENCENDEVNDFCSKLILSLKYSSYQILPIFITGRPEKIRIATDRWLYHHLLVHNPFIFMRPDGDFRPDYIVKKEIYEREIKGKYDVLFAIDDRQQVVDMWREEGLVCLQCDKGDF